MHPRVLGLWLPSIAGGQCCPPWVARCQAFGHPATSAARASSLGPSHCEMPGHPRNPVNRGAPLLAPFPEPGHTTGLPGHVPGRCGASPTPGGGVVRATADPECCPALPAASTVRACVQHSRPSRAGASRDPAVACSVWGPLGASASALEESLKSCLPRGLSCCCRGGWQNLRRG